MRDLPVLLDELEQAAGPARPVPSSDGWELVLAENVAYLVDDQRRWRALEELRRVVGLDPAALDANALRVLSRLGYGHPARSYSASYRQAQAEASARLPGTVPALQRAAQLLRRHGQTVCRRRDPACPDCVIAGDCPSAGHPPPLY